MSRMCEPVLVHTREQTGQEKHSLRTGRLCETSRVQFVNRIDSSDMASQTAKGRHGISLYDELPNLETLPSHSKLPEFFDGFDHSKHVAQHSVLAREEPLQIQCGENSALLYASKLCQGSKGPCILFQDKWLTPNELQFISGRETAKDWKRSIRYKGRSLKTLIARGLLRVHPPMCDCNGCRISSPVNRSRLTNKLTRDAPKLFSPWHDERIHGSRHLSSSDIKHPLDHRASATSNAIDRPDSNSSTSECSEVSAEESAFYSAGDTKRPRNLTSPAMDRAGARKRRASEDSGSACYPGQERNFDGIERNMSKRSYADPSMHKDSGAIFPLEGQTQDQASIHSDTDMQAVNTSAFHMVLKDGFLTPPKEAGDSITCSQSDALKQEVLARTFERRGPTPAHRFYPPELSQCLSPARRCLPGQNTSRLIAEQYLLASQASKIYQRAELQYFQKLYMQYGPVSPMHQKLVPHNLQASAMLSDSAARASVESSSPRQTSSRCASPVPEESSWKDKYAGKGEARSNGEGPFCGTASNEAGNHAAQENGQENAAQVSSPSSSDNPISLVDLMSPLHERVPRLNVDLREDVLTWNADDVCHFVLSITRSAEVTQAFRDENIDGHSLVFIREEHLLDRMSVKLGPALKILAQVNKLLENLEIDKASDRTGCKTNE